MRGLICALLLWLTALPALAQERATLVADGLRIAGDQVLIAEGNVEIFYKGQRLTAARVVYDRKADRLEITGPITLTDGQKTVIVADQASLKADLTEGILLSARVVLDQQLQIAAAEVHRLDGRYTTMKRVAASSCRICAGDDTPLWELRASQVTHDQAEQQLYFDNAQLRMAGLPVFYIPRLRMPDPTLKRATGFLMPRATTSSKIGTGLWLPYFITLGQSRDLTVTPFLSPAGSRTVALRYREAFRTGDVEVGLHLSRDDILTGDIRGYLLAEGQFALPRGLTMDIRAERVSDKGYLLDYGLPEADLLRSHINLTRTRRNEYLVGRLIGFQTLRETESNATIPSIVADFTWHRRFSLGSFGGEGGLSFQLHSHSRTSTLTADGDGDGIADGRDLARGSIKADWRRDWVLGNGMVAGLLGEGRADLYAISQDAAEAGTEARLHGALAAELRWPWVKPGKNGVAHVIEPVVQLVLAPAGSDSLTNEDSALVEFDEGNLFALNRYPGSDAVERGARANIGLNYLRHDPSGWTLGITAGRVFRAEDLGQFTAASGLDGVQSDWLAAWSLTAPWGLSLTNRVLLDDGLDLTKGELRLGLTAERLTLSAGYVYVAADLAENRPERTEELVFDSTVKLSRGWSAQLSNRYDLVEDRASRAAAGLVFRNECLAVDLSLSRRFTSSTSVTPTTEFGLSVELLGFGGGSDGGAQRQCRG